MSEQFRARWQTDSPRSEATRLLSFFLNQEIQLLDRYIFPFQKLHRFAWGLLYAQNILQIPCRECIPCLNYFCNTRVFLL